MFAVITKLYRAIQYIFALSSLVFGILMPTQIACLQVIAYIGFVVCFVNGIMTFYSVTFMKKIIDDLTKANTQYAALNKEHADRITELNTSLTRQEKINRTLLLVQSQSQALLESLMQTGDDFKGFGKILSETTNKNLTLADKLSLLVSGMTKKDFEQMDVNRDGVVTFEEFSQFKN